MPVRGTVSWHRVVAPGRVFSHRSRRSLSGPRRSALRSSSAASLPRPRPASPGRPRLGSWSGSACGCCPAGPWGGGTVFKAYIQLEGEIVQVPPVPHVEVLHEPPGPRPAHLEVVLHFVLQEARVLLQGPSELCHAVAELQQLHRVAPVVPRGRDVLQHVKNNGI